MRKDLCSLLFFDKIKAKYESMALKINDQFIRLGSGKASSVFLNKLLNQCPESQRGYSISCYGLSQDRMIDQALMAQESQKRDYKVDLKKLS